MDGTSARTGTEIANGALFARDGWIERVGPTSELPSQAATVIDARGMVVMPGLVNTHHHLYQSLTRGVPGAESSGLFDWLRTLYPIWSRLTPEHVQAATALGLAELALTGCTTAFDHQYIWPNGSTIADQFAAAEPVGIRFHASRGSMSLGESEGGLPPDDIVEDENAILTSTIDAIDEFHDPSPGSMRQVAVAPCSPFSVSPDLMKASAALARDRGVMLHTHLAETADEDAYCREHFGARPLKYAESVGWIGEDVWFAHGVHISKREMKRLADSGTGIAHCPTSNMRLASGIAPVVAYLNRGIHVGLGVDGSASNDSSSIMAEARQAMLLARLSTAIDGGEQMPARTALWLATRGGAEILGRDDIGALEPGKACDVAMFETGTLERSGFVDPVAALVLGAPGRVHTLVVNGTVVVEDHELVGIDEQTLTREHTRLSRSLFA